MNKSKTGTVPAFFCIVLLLLAGCKDMFHPDGPKDNNNGNNTSTGPFTVTFNADGGNPETQTRQVNDGASVGSANIPSAARGGYTFGGWYTEKDGKGTQFSGSTKVTGDITVYAKWTSSSSGQYTVTFNADGGSPEIQTRQVNSGASIGSANLPSADRSGHTFGGWYTERGGGGTQFTGGTAVTEDITVYAKWTPVIAPPAGLTVTGQTANSISLSWQAVSEAASYKVYKGTGAGNVSELAETTLSTFCTVTGLSANTAYYFTVCSVAGNTESSPSAAVQGTTTEITLPAPENLRISGQTSNSLTLSWQAVSGAEGYRISRSTGSGGPFDPIKTTASLSYTDNVGLTPSTTYYYRVTAYKGPDESNAAEVSGTTASVDGTLRPRPTKPTGLVVSSSSSGSVSLSWAGATNADSYDVYRANTKTGALARIGTNIMETSWTDFTVSGGLMYYYTARGVNTSGSSPDSNMAFACAVSHFDLPNYSSSWTVNLYPNTKDYYRLAVSAGQRITITWQDGNNQNATSNIRVSAWQNDGTEIFRNSTGGYTSPKEFAVTEAGYVTVEVNNSSSSTGYNYQIYYSF